MSKRECYIFSTLPVGGATRAYEKIVKLCIISIHAPRGGSDSKDAQISGCIFGEGIEVCRVRPRKSRTKPVQQQEFFAQNHEKAVRTSREFLRT